MEAVVKAITKTQDARQSVRFAFIQSLTLAIAPLIAPGCMCGQTLLQHPQVSTAAETTSSYDSLLLGSGDLLDIQVFETPELSTRVRVSPAGTITLPVGGQVTVEKLTPLQAATLIEARLRQGQVMSDPHVTVFVNEYATQGVTVIGEVRNPGTYTLLGEHSLYRAISAAGGTSSNAGASITISHRNAPDSPLVIPVHSANYSQMERSVAVQPGDIIVVSKADLIYVVGDVGHPGAYYQQSGEPISVLNALALASGLNHTAAGSKASIVRKKGDGATIIPVNLNNVMKNKDKNLVLEASDILVIPRSGAKVLLETALPSATAAVTGAVTTALVLR
jgi:polysaccharide export outer membrane protein